MKPTALVVLICMTCLGCAKRNFFAPTPLVQSQSVTPGPASTDSVLVQAGKHYAHGSIYSLLFGKHYRNVWAATVPARVLDMEAEHGGMQIVEIGGSMQSTSFTLADAKGIEYALRTVDKDPAGTLPSYLQKTIIANFLRDQTAALNPYAALVVAPLAEAASIPHASPELVYLPADSTVLGKYINQAGDKLYMLEKKTNQKAIMQPDTAHLKDIITSKKLLEKRFKKNKHQVDQQVFAKARLFDIYINDRDRHQGQWNWAEFKMPDKTLYKPIPKDRDQAFYRFADGFLPRVVGRGLNFQKFISFRNDFRDLEALNYKSEYIDKHFLNELTEAQFISLAKELQTSLTDKVIENAVHALPTAAYNEIGESMTTALKSRRDVLAEAAKTYYKILAKEIAVVGTDEEERFVVERLDDSRVSVTMFNKENNSILYQRIFHRDETKEINLFGLGDDDIFELSGEVNKSIKVMINGGLGEDEITDASKVKGWRKMTIVQDSSTGNKFSFGSETKDKTSSNAAVHAFNRKGD